MDKIIKDNLDAIVLTSDIPWQGNTWTVGKLKFKRKGQAPNYWYEVWKDSKLQDNTLDIWGVIRWAKTGKPPVNRYFAKD